MKKILIILTILSCALIMSACKKTVIYTTEDYVKISISGLNGCGKAGITIDRDSFYGKVDNDCFNGKGTDLELAQMEVLIYDSVKFSTEDETENLSNGDTITVKLTADNEKLREYGVKFDEKDYTYTVEGLQDPVELDIWSGLSVTFSGTAPNGNAVIEYIGSDEFIKNNIIYYLADSYGLSNGDTVTVEASYNQSVLDENLYTVKENSKKYTVSGLAEYLKSTSGFDMSAADEMLREKAQKTSDNSSYATDDWVYSAKLMSNGNLSEKWTVKSIDLQPEKTIFLCAEDGTRNIYGIYWNMNITAEKTYTNQFVAEPDGYALGDTETFDVFILTYMDNLIVDVDSKLNTESSGVYQESYGNSIMGNYLDKSLDDLMQMFFNDHSSYTVIIE